MSLHELTAIELRDGIAAGRVSSVEATRATLDRIERIDPTVGAYLSTFSDRAMQAAETVDRRIAAGEPVGPLAGVPVAVKDVMCTSFDATTCASRILENFHAPYDATAIRKLLAADAVLVGKTNMDEFAMGSSPPASAASLASSPRMEECPATAWSLTAPVSIRSGPSAGPWRTRR